MRAFKFFITACIIACALISSACFSKGEPLTESTAEPTRQPTTAEVISETTVPETTQKPTEIATTEETVTETETEAVTEEAEEILEIRYGFLNEEDSSVFLSVAEEYPELEPVALLGKQLVAGTNYMFLCHENNGGNRYKIVVAYENFNGRVEVTDVYDYSFDESGASELSCETAGGWNPVSDYSVISLPEDIETPFSELSSADESVIYDALACVDYGRNCYVISHVTDRSREAESCSGIAVIEFARNADSVEKNSERYINLARY